MIESLAIDIGRLVHCSKVCRVERAIQAIAITCLFFFAALLTYWRRAWAFFDLLIRLLLLQEFHPLLLNEFVQYFASLEEVDVINVERILAFLNELRHLVGIGDLQIIEVLLFRSPQVDVPPLLLPLHVLVEVLLETVARALPIFFQLQLFKLLLLELTHVPGPELLVEFVLSSLRVIHILLAQASV